MTNAELLAAYPGKLRSQRRKLAQCRLLSACRIATSRPITARCKAAREAFEREPNWPTVKAEFYAAYDALFKHMDHERHDGKLIETPTQWAAYIEPYLPVADTDEVSGMIAEWDAWDREHARGRL